MARAASAHILQDIDAMLHRSSRRIRLSAAEHVVWKRICADSEHDGRYRTPEQLWVELQQLFPRLDGFAGGLVPQGRPSSFNCPEAQ